MASKKPVSPTLVSKPPSARSTPDTTKPLPPSSEAQKPPPSPPIPSASNKPKPKEQGEDPALSAGKGEDAGIVSCESSTGGIFLICLVSELTVLCLMILGAFVSNLEPIFNTKFSAISRYFIQWGGSFLSDIGSYVFMWYALFAFVFIQIDGAAMF